MNILTAKLGKDVSSIVNEYLMVDKQTVKDNYRLVVRSIDHLRPCVWCGMEMGDKFIRGNQFRRGDLDMFLDLCPGRTMRWIPGRKPDWAYI
jgi:hypothetical protein